MPHGAYMALVRDGHLLALLRVEDDHPLFKNIWDLPGGIVEPGEQAFQAALRETEEETGLVVTRGELLRDWTHPWTDGGKFRVTTFIGWDYEGEIRLSPEHSSYAWMTPAAIGGQQFAEHQLRSPVFAAWLEGLRTDMRLLTDRLARGNP